MRADTKEPLLLQIAELQEELSSVKSSRDRAAQALDALQTEARQAKIKARWNGDNVVKLEKWGPFQLSSSVNGAQGAGLKSISGQVCQHVCASR